MINEWKILKQNKAIKETKKELENLENNIISSGSDGKKVRLDILRNKQILVEQESTLKKMEVSRVSNGLYAAIAVTSIVLMATAASVVTAGLFPAALAVGVGVISLGIMAAEHLTSRSINNKAKTDKLKLQFDGIKSKNDLLPENSKFNFDKQSSSAQDSSSFKDYIDLLIKTSPKEAEKVIEQLDLLMDSHLTLDTIEPNDNVGLLIAKERESIELGSMKLLLSELKVQPTGSLSAEQLFDKVLATQDLVAPALPVSDLEKRLMNIEPQIKSMSSSLGTDLTAKLSVSGQRPKSIMDYLFACDD